jgi:hypothetical protein
VPLFDQFIEKALNNFMSEYLVPEIEYSTNLSLDKHSGAAPQGVDSYTYKNVCK